MTAVSVLLVTAYRMDAQWMSRHVTVLHFWPARDGEAWSTRARAVLVLLAALLIGLRPVLIALSSKASLGGLVRSTVAALLAVAVYALILEVVRTGPAAGHEHGVPHPRYGWTFRPSSTTTEWRSGRDVHVAVDRGGIRVRDQNDEPDPELPTILFAGESIADGFGLEYAETFPALIAARRGVQCVNLAANAYASDQAYLRLVDAMPRFQRLVATVTVLIPLQLSRNLHDDRPRLAQRPSGELELLPAADDFLSKLRIRRLFWKDLPYLGDRAIDRTLALTSAILRETNSRTRARGATPLFVVPSRGPNRPLDEHPEAWVLRAVFVQQGLPFILVDLPPDQLQSDEAHPGPRGDETIAAAILAALPSGR